MNDELRLRARKALNSLYLVTERSVVDGVQDAVWGYVNALESEAEQYKAAHDALAEGQRLKQEKDGATSEPHTKDCLMGYSDPDCSRCSKARSFLKWERRWLSGAPQEPEAQTQDGDGGE